MFKSPAVTSQPSTEQYTHIEEKKTSFYALYAISVLAVLGGMGLLCTFASQVSSPYFAIGGGVFLFGFVALILIKIEENARKKRSEALLSNKNLPVAQPVQTPPVRVDGLVTREAHSAPALEGAQFYRPYQAWAIQKFNAWTCAQREAASLQPSTVQGPNIAKRAPFLSSLGAVLKAHFSTLKPPSTPSTTSVAQPAREDFAQAKSRMLGLSEAQGEDVCTTK